MVLTDALVQSGMPLSARTVPLAWRWGPLGRSQDDPSFTGATLAFRGVGLRPYPPAQGRLVRAASGDLRLSWIRRTRIDGDPWEQLEVPLAAATEAYWGLGLPRFCGRLRGLAEQDLGCGFWAVLLFVDEG